MKLNETEVSTGNASGKAGIASLPFGRGFYNYGGNNGASGIGFTPSGEPSFKTYKSMKHSKKNIKKRMKKFKEFIKEDAFATLGNTGGMGPISPAIPSATPGSVNAPDSIAGSGDIGQTFGGAFMKSAPNLRKRKDGKYKMKKLKSYSNFKP